MTSHLSASQKKKKKGKVGVKEFFATSYLVTKITNNLLIPRSLSVWLSLSLSHSNGSTHTHTNTSAVLSAKSPDSLSRLWKQLKCYV